MQVREIMSSNVKQIGSSAMIAEAAERMRKYDVGVLPVIQDRKTIGLITDRDIVIRAVAAGIDPRTTPVKDVITPGAVCCNEHEEVEKAARLMEDNQVHRVLVVDSENKMVGILSVGDLAMKTSDEHLAHEVLERVCEPVRGE